jgi:hypothetical protein
MGIFNLEIDGCAPCYPAFLQLALIHERHRDGVNHAGPYQLAAAIYWRPMGSQWSSSEASWPRPNHDGHQRAALLFARQSPFLTAEQMWWQPRSQGWSNTLCRWTVCGAGSE